MFKIGQFSKINQITVKTLHHYDEIGLLKPSETDEWTGYRLYSTEQLIQIQRIIALKQLGLSLGEIKEVMSNEKELHKVLDTLNNKALQFENELQMKKNQLHNLQSFISFLRKENNMPTHVTIKKLPAVIIASKRLVIKNYEQLNQEMPAFGKAMAKQGVKCVVPDYCFNLYHDGEYKQTDVDVEICQAVTKLYPNQDGIVYKELPAIPEAACIYHRGSYQTLGQTYAALMKWVEDNHYEITDLPRESYIDGIWNKDDESEWLTELQLPIKRK